MREGQYISLEYVIDKLKQQYGFSDISIPDAREHVWDAIGIIGVPQSMEDKYLTKVLVERYRAPLPLDFYDLQPTDVAIRETKSHIPFRHLSDRFFKGQEISDEDPEISISLIAGQSFYHDPNDPDAEGTTYFSKMPEVSKSDEYTYRIATEHIFFGKQSTEVDIAYKAFPIDDKGSPKILDDPKYVRAIISYLAERIAFKKFLMGQLAGDKYQLISQQYSFNVGSAQTGALIPSAEKLENMKNRAHLLVRRSDHFTRGFRDLGNSFK